MKNWEQDQYVDFVTILVPRDQVNIVQIEIIIAEYAHWETRVLQPFVQTFVASIKPLIVKTEMVFLEVDRYIQKCQLLTPLDVAK